MTRFGLVLLLLMWMLTGCGGPVSASFDLERSYTNFVMYLYDKLHPDYLALMVEANLFKELEAPCPANWDALMMNVGDDSLMRVYPADWDGAGDCLLRVSSAQRYTDVFRNLPLILRYPYVSQWTGMRLNRP